ncbi:unnamed protein product [Ceratitis capitata]|uniref:(Mediterranean fruit fly) hypothetical protein n=1 Tax=Ceratitis capitata TaxID=7213 RepID=A0A811UXT8_CERCA|nr:unnamed protein product [Ceratitis capitata]
MQKHNQHRTTEQNRGERSVAQRSMTGRSLPSTSLVELAMCGAKLLGRAARFRAVNGQRWFGSSKKKGSLAAVSLNNWASVTTPPPSPPLLSPATAPEVVARQYCSVAATVTQCLPEC